MNNIKQNISKRIILINEILELNSNAYNILNNSIEPVIAILMELKEDYYIEPDKEYDIFMIILNKINDFIFDASEYLKYYLLNEDKYYHIINNVIYNNTQVILKINTYLDELDNSININNMMSNMNLN